MEAGRAENGRVPQLLSLRLLPGLDLLPAQFSATHTQHQVVPRPIAAAAGDCRRTLGMGGSLVQLRLEVEYSIGTSPDRPKTKIILVLLHLFLFLQVQLYLMARASPCPSGSQSSIIPLETAATLKSLIPIRRQEASGTLVYGTESHLERALAIAVLQADCRRVDSALELGANPNIRGALDAITKESSKGQIAESKGIPLASYLRGFKPLVFAPSPLIVELLGCDHFPHIGAGAEEKAAEEGYLGLLHSENDELQAPPNCTMFHVLTRLLRAGADVNPPILHQGFPLSPTLAQCDRKMWEGRCSSGEASLFHAAIHHCVGEANQIEESVLFPFLRYLVSCILLFWVREVLTMGCLDIDGS